MSNRAYVYGEMPDGQQLLVGVFVSKDGDGFFKYHDNWLKNGYQVSFDLPLSNQIHQKSRDVNQGVFGALRDAMPDFWGRLVASKTLKKPFESLTQVDLMLSTDGFSQVGALTFHSTQSFSLPIAKPPTVVDLALLCEAASMIEKNVKDIPEEYLMLLQQGSSMGGARPKTTIINDGILYLAKLPSERDTINNAALESACLVLAQMCGISVPKHSILSIQGFGDVLLLERFDREKDIKIPYQSGLSLLGLDESENVYGGYPRISVEMRKTGMPESDNKRLYRHMVFNCLIRNTDDHLRNHGFLMKQNQWQLSPLFDLAPTPVITGVGREFFSSINIGVNGRVATVYNLLSSANAFLMDAAEAGKIIEDIAKTITNNWQQVFHEKDIDANLFSGCFDNNLHDEIGSSDC